MPAKITASTSSGLVLDSDLSGSLALVANGITVATLNGTGANAGIQMGSSMAPAFSAYLAGTQTLPGTNTFTKILFDTEEYDTNGNFDITTNKGRFTPTVAGYYLFTWNIEITSAYAFTLGGVYKNGSVAKQGNWHNGSSGASIGSAVVYANGSTDYFELFINFNGNGQNVGGGSAGYWFQGTLIRSA